MTLTLIKYEFQKKEPYGTKNTLKHFIGYNFDVILWNNVF